MIIMMRETISLTSWVNLSCSLLLPGTSERLCTPPQPLNALFIVRSCRSPGPGAWIAKWCSTSLQDLKKRFKDLLLDHYRASGKSKPDRLIMYRDGVSEGQFNEVQRAEVTQILAACQELDADWYQRVKLTFIVVQKRHHTRMFPADSRDADRSGNVIAGAPARGWVVAHLGLLRSLRVTTHRVLQLHCLTVLGSCRG